MSKQLVVADDGKIYWATVVKSKGTIDREKSTDLTDQCIKSVMLKMNSQDAHVEYQIEGFGTLTWNREQKPEQKKL